VVADMRAAAARGNLQAFYERDLRFHLTLCRKSENPVLEQILSRLLVPLFAFVVMRTHDTMEDRDRWLGSIARHEAILAAIRSGDAERAAETAAATIQYFYIDIDELTRGRL
jgi:DNA-binding GntR family transcriptional regulator